MATETAGRRDPARAVRISRSEQEAKADLEKELPGAGGRLLILSPKSHLRGLLLPLRGAGVLKELVAVLPYDNVVLPEHLDGIRAVLGKEGVSADDLKTFALNIGAVPGRIDGMPVLLCTLPGIPVQERGILAAVDTAFLPAIYRNEVKTPMVELAWKLVLTLRDRRASSGAAIVFDAAGQTDFPLEFGYLAALLKEMLSDPGLFETTLPEKWRTLQAAEWASFFGQSAEAMTAFREYLRMSPGDASACYRIAMIAVRDLDDDMALHWLNKAASADPRFARAFAEAADYLAQRKLLDPAERILRAGVAAFPGDPRMATSLAAFFILRGQRLREEGDPEGAAEYFAMAAQVKGADPAVREKANTLMKRGDANAPAPR